MLKSLVYLVLSSAERGGSEDDEFGGGDLGGAGAAKAVKSRPVIVGNGPAKRVGHTGK